MWKIFHNKTLNILESFQSVNDWKTIVYSKMDVKIKQYFAQKVVVYFDNMMLFQPKKGLQDNLLESLSIAEKEMQKASGLFADISCYWIPENNNTFLITSNLPNDISFFPINYGFELIKDDAIPADGNMEKLYNSAWSNLIFSAELSDFAKGWINYTPSLEERAFLQTKYLLLMTNFKTANTTLLEKIELEENIENHPQFKELYNKIFRVMPRIENSLEEEWRTTIVKGNVPILKNKKK